METQRRRGFTLVELLVAVSLTAVLMTGMVLLYQGALAVSGVAMVEAEIVSGGRAALELMCRDIERAFPPDTGYLVIEPSEPCGKVRFGAAVPGLGPCHLSYQVRDLGPARKRMLCRCVKPMGGNDGIPADADYTDVSPLGIELDELTFEHVALSGEVESGGGTWSGSGARYPRSVLVRIRLSDKARRVNLVLSRGCVLMASGL